MFQLYDDLISDWRSFAAKLAAIGGPDGKALCPAIAREIESFLCADLKRQRTSRPGLARLPAGAAMLAQMYDRMVQAAATGDETALRACFDRLNEGVWETANLFRDVAAARARDHRDEIARVETTATVEAGRRATRCG
jgi:hypothetical protein